MAGTLTATADVPIGGITRHHFAWTSHASNGTVTGNPRPVCPGLLLEVTVLPTTSGGTQPTDLFDLILADADGLDVLGERGADCSHDAPTALVFDPPLPFIGGTLDVQIAAAGNSKTGAIDILVRNP
jgi:hypothetical protein